MARGSPPRFSPSGRTRTIRSIRRTNRSSRIYRDRCKRSGRLNLSTQHDKDVAAWWQPQFENDRKLTAEMHVAGVRLLAGKRFARPVRLRRYKPSPGIADARRSGAYISRSSPDRNDRTRQNIWRARTRAKSPSRIAPIWSFSRATPPKTSARPRTSLEWFCEEDISRARIWMRCS